MAIETQPDTAPRPGGQGPARPTKTRVWWMRPAIHTALIGAVLGYLLGHWLGNFLASGYQQLPLSDSNDMPIVLGYAFGAAGWLGGLGVFNDIFRKMAGRPASRHPYLKVVTAELATRNLARYFRYSLDHKVVGIQYLAGMIVYFLTGGLAAIAIRAELLSPAYHVLSPGAYLMVVGEHGTMMMMMMTSVILGPFGNYLVPLMIGSKRVAFPRIEALSFWLTPAAYLILLSGILLGGFPTGWTGYPPLSVQAGLGMDSYAVAFGLMGISVILAGFNIIVTVINYRAPGMRWSRLPVFVWSMVATAFLMVLAAPVLLGGMYMILTDRTAQTAFFTDTLGGSSYLYQNLFWFFGHPEVYILALPGFGVVAEIIPVFCRKPLFGYRIAAAGMIGVSLLSFFVWQHHLFDSGINPDMRPLFMLTTELISIPTGFIYLVAMGTFWKAKIRLTVPMLFALGLYFNFLIGGISGVFLSDVPADTTEHGSFFVMAHFHYTIMGGLIFAFMAAIYYWLPKMMGIKLNQTLGKIHFCTMFVFFNSTFLPLFAVGLLGQPRRVFEYQRQLQTLNDWVSISAFLLGGSILIFVINFAWSTVIVREPETGNPWRSRGLEWQTTSPPPADNFDQIPVVLSGPYEYGVPGAPPVADLAPPPGVVAGALAGAASSGTAAEATLMTEIQATQDNSAAEEELFYHEASLNAAWAGSRLAVGALAFLFGAFVFGYFYLRSLNPQGMWKPSGFIPPHLWLGTLIMGLVVLSAAVQSVVLRLLKRGARSLWQLGGIAALVFGLGAVGLQIWELLSLPFFPGASGFASVFVGFCPVYAVIALAAMIWLETLIVGSVRLPAAWFAELPPATGDLVNLQRFQASLSSFTVVWNFLAAIAILAWILFYLV